jgi:hypothetical protein
VVCDGSPETRPKNDDKIFWMRDALLFEQGVGLVLANQIFFLLPDETLFS